MSRKLRAMWIIITQAGPVARMVRQVDEFFRFHVLNTLSREGVFDYLEQPRPYGQLLAEFGFVDSDYTRALFDGLASDRRGVVVKEGHVYRRNPAQAVPTLEDILARTDARYHSFTHMAEGMAANIPARLRCQPVELSSSFEADGRTLLARFDRTLGNRVFGAIRRAAFAYLTPEERAWLRGKHLLDVGCGTGRETAALWLHLGGTVKITAIDPVARMLHHAEQNFEALLKELDPDHPPVTEGNRPVFNVLSATHLPFENMSFDAVFHSQVLHWTPEPSRVIAEVVRVLRPGGLVFGSQITRPHSNPYMDMVVRTNENAYGFFWEEEFQHWYGQHGVQPETATSLGVFRAQKPECARS